jgi:hypothetical protein
VTGLFRPGDPELKPLAPQAAQSLTRDLGRLDALQNRVGVLTFSDPSEGSPAARDSAEPERFYAHHQAQSCIQAALDHLVAWRNLLFRAGIMPLYAHMSRCGQLTRPHCWLNGSWTPPSATTLVEPAAPQSNWMTTRSDGSSKTRSVVHGFLCGGSPPLAGSRTSWP